MKNTTPTVVPTSTSKQQMYSATVSETGRFTLGAKLTDDVMECHTGDSDLTALFLADENNNVYVGFADTSKELTAMAANHMKQAEKSAIKTLNADVVGGMVVEFGAFAVEFTDNSFRWQSKPFRDLLREQGIVATPTSKKSSFRLERVTDVDTNPLNLPNLNCLYKLHSATV